MRLKSRLLAVTALYCLVQPLCSAYVWAEEVVAAPPPIVRFAIKKYQVDGNSLLPPDQIQQALTPYVGQQRDFGDVQRALEALEGLYRARGYSTVYVAVPEQELDRGVVRLQVVEGRIGKVEVTGNKYFSEANVRASLPALKEGTSPIAARMSENIQLANENPAKQVEVVLGVGEEEGVVNANVKVTDQNPFRFSISYDNTGSPATGYNRTGVALQHHNAADGDQSFTAAYTSSIDRPPGVNVDVYSFGYRVPLYNYGDSIDLIYANSSTGVPSSSPSLGGALGIVGKGEIFGVRWNRLLPREGEYSSRIVLSLDSRLMESSCKTATGTPLTGVAGCEPYYVRPFTVTYIGKLEQATRMIGFSAGLATNTDNSGSSTYNLASSSRQAPTAFLVEKFAGSYMQALPQDWQIRMNGQAQLVRDPLVPTEQIGLAGSTAVRGFQERAVATDQGFFVQSELYSPEIAPLLHVPGNLRALAFYDFARGESFRTSGTTTNGLFGIASVGLGLRYSYSRDASWRFDLAQVLDSFTATVGGTPTEDKWRAHFGLNLSF